MKKNLYLFLLILLSLYVNAQTLHKQYSINYCGTGYCHQTTVIHGNRYYIAFVEDTALFAGNKHHLTVMKNDLNGNVLWKRTYQFSGSYTATAAPRKILAAGPNLYIGGNLQESTGQYPFIASIDTTNGNVNYFNRYTSSFSSTDIKINDLTLLNNGDVLAVGRIMNGVNKFFYCLRVAGTTGTIINNGMSTYYMDQEATSVCQFSNGSIAIAGIKGSTPFISKLMNNSGLFPMGSYLLNSMPASSTITQIIKSGNYLVIMGSTNGTGQNNFIARIDSTINSSVGSPYILNVYPGGNFIPTYLYQRGSQVMVSGITSGGNSVLFFNAALAFQSGYAYGSTASLDHSLQYYNGKTYLTTGTWNTGSNLRLYKGDSTAFTSCATLAAPNFSLLTVTYQVGQIGVFSNGSLSPITPLLYYKSITPVTTCLSTGMENISSLSEVELFSTPDAYIINSPMQTISELLIYDMSGKLLEHRVNIKSAQERINLQPFNSGIYLVKVKYGNSQKVFKLINQ